MAVFKNERLSPREEKVMSRLRDMYRSMSEERNEIQSLIDEVQEYFRPYRLASMFSDGYNLKSGIKIYDGEPIAAKNRLSAGFFAWLISPSLDWLQFEPPRDFTKSQMRVARMYCDELERFVYDSFRDNNFYEQVALAIDEEVTCGTVAMIAENNPKLDQTNFTTLAINDFLNSDDRYGVSDTLIRRVKMRQRNLVAMFPEKFDQREREKLLRDGEKMCEILHFIYPAIEGDKFFGVHEYASVYTYSPNVSSDGIIGSRASKLLAEKGMAYKPFAVGKGEEIPGHSCGGAATFNALYDAKMINLQSKTMMDMAQLVANPPLIADEGLKGALRIMPKGVTFRSRPDEQVQAIYTANQYPVGMDAMARKSANLNEHFNAKYFMAISGIQDSSRERTRAEIVALQGEGAAALSKMVGSTNRLLIEPMIRIFLQIEAENGRLPEVPEGLSLEEGQALVLGIKLKGPLAQAQRKYVNQQNVVTALTTASQFATIDRNVIKKYDYIAASADTARDGGLDEKYIRSDEEVEAAIQAEAEQQRALLAAEQKERAIKSMPAAAKAPEPGSYLEKVFAQGLGDTL